jgi:transposase
MGALRAQPITNGGTEEIGSKIMSIKRRVEGYSDRDNIRLAVLFHRGGLNL